MNFKNGLNFFFIMMVLISTIQLYKKIPDLYQIIFKDNKYKWEKIEAEIITVKLIEPNFSIHSNEKCQISYAYFYNGKKYFGNNLGLNKKRPKEKEFIGTFELQPLHEAIYEKVKNKKKIAIYVNPNAPKQSVIIKYDFILSEVIACILFFVIPILFYFMIHFITDNSITKYIELK